MFFAGIPINCAVSACAFNCLYSPWTGIKNFGFASANINFCSSWQACPETWTSANALYTTSAPICIKSSITFETDFSFPGIGFAEIITKSFGVILTFLWSPAAILVNADIVSPWLPVVIITSCSSLYVDIVSISINISSGQSIYPNSFAVEIIFIILLPHIAIFLWYFTAELTICWTLCTFDANVATTILFVHPSNNSSNTGPIELSDIVNPFLSAFVLSDINAKIPSFPSSAILPRSIIFPSIGV